MTNLEVWLIGFFLIWKENVCATRHVFIIYFAYPRLFF